MPDNKTGVVFTKNVIEFVTVALEFCSFLEKTEGTSYIDFTDRLSKLLSLLYLKALMLPDVNDTFNLELDKEVTEFDYQFVKKGIEQILGDADQYLDFYDTNMKETHEPVASSIAENIADIYQDLKDFLFIFKTGQENMMNDALQACRENFKDYWGYRVVNSLRMLHFLQFNPLAMNEKQDDLTDNKSKDKDQSLRTNSNGQRAH